MGKKDDYDYYNEDLQKSAKAFLLFVGSLGAFLLVIAFI